MLKAFVAGLSDSGATPLAVTVSSRATSTRPRLLLAERAEPPPPPPGAGVWSRRSTTLATIHGVALDLRCVTPASARPALRRANDQSPSPPRPRPSGPAAISSWSAAPSPPHPTRAAAAAATSKPRVAEGLAARAESVGEALALAGDELSARRHPPPQGAVHRGFPQRATSACSRSSEAARPSEGGWRGAQAAGRARRNAQDEGRSPSSRCSSSATATRSSGRPRSSPPSRRSRGRQGRGPPHDGGDRHRRDPPPAGLGKEQRSKLLAAIRNC